MDDGLYRIYLSMRNIVDNCYNNQVSNHVKQFVECLDSACTSFDKQNPEYYKRWKKEFFVCKEQ